MGAGGSRVLRRRVVLGSHFIHVKFQPARSSFITTTISAGVQLDVSPPSLEISPALSVARGGGDSES